MLLAFFVAGAAYAYTPPDSCLEMIWPDDYVHESNVYSVNPDSIKYDNCPDSPTFDREFAKRYWILQFRPYYYPFDKVLKPDTIKRVSDISSSKSELKQIFEQLESELGLIYFKGYEFEEPDYVVMKNPVLRIYFQKYQDIEFINDTFKLLIDSLLSIGYINKAVFIIGVEESYQDRNNSNEISIFPNPVKDILYLESTNEYPTGLIKIYSAFGTIQMESIFKREINISCLSDGLYCLVYKDRIYKFIKTN
jgi:hypothetical protein